MRKFIALVALVAALTATSANACQHLNSLGLDCAACAARPLPPRTVPPTRPASPTRPPSRPPPRPTPRPPSLGRSVPPASSPTGAHPRPRSGSLARLRPRFPDPGPGPCPGSRSSLWRRSWVQLLLGREPGQLRNELPQLRQRGPR